MFIKILDFLSLLDEQKRLSITNSHIWIMTGLFGYSLVKGTAPESAWAIIAGLSATLINYGHKRYAIGKNEKIKAQKILDEAKKLHDKTDEKQKELETEVTRLKNHQNLKTSRQAAGVWNKE